MRTIAILASALIGMATAHAADDPAITICEEVIKAKLRAPKSYERVSAVIDGVRVHVTFDAVNVFNAPLRDRKTCRFALTANNTFTLTSDRAKQIEVKIDRINSDMEGMKQRNHTLDDLDKIKKRLDAVLQEAAEAMIEGIADIAVAQKVEGFPIPAARTKLDASQAD